MRSRFRNKAWNPRITRAGGKARLLEARGRFGGFLNGHRLPETIACLLSRGVRRLFQGGGGQLGDDGKEKYTPLDFLTHFIEPIQLKI